MKNILRLIAGGFLSAMLALAAHAADIAAGAYSAGTVKGDVTYRLAGTSSFLPLAAGAALPQGATIKTGPNSTATLVFSNGATALIEQDSEIEVSKFEQEMFSGPIPMNAEPSVSHTEIKVLNGGVVSKIAKLKKGSTYVVNSPVGAAGVRGTTFRVFYNAATGAFRIETADGLVVFTSTGGAETAVPADQQLVGTGENGAVTIEDLPPAAKEAINNAVSNTPGTGTAPTFIVTPVTVDPTQTASPN